MATKVVVCPECESPLVPGRFSCAGCGAVLARVASDARSFAPVEPAAPPALDLAPPPADLESLAAPDAADDPAVDEDAPLGSALEERDEDPEPESVAPPVEEPAWPEPPAPAPIDRAEWAAAATAAASWQAPPAPPNWPPAPPEASASPVAAQRTPAGAYLPPSAVLPSGESLPVNGKADAGAAGDGAMRRRSLAERFALGEEDGPLGLPAELPGRTIALGAAIAGLGFLLPWAEIVIGSASIGGFLDQWGLAAPGHPLMLLALVAVGGLAVLRERTEVKVGTSTAAIILGAVLMGIAFPYVMGPFREAVGVYVTLSGALLLIVGGLLARAAPRHDPVAEAV
jgi:hypothetical protein